MADALGYDGGMDRAQSEAAGNSAQSVEPTRTEAQGTQAANLAAAAAVTRRLASSPQAVAEKFMGVLTRGQVPVTLNDKELAAQLGALLPMCTGPAADLVTRARDKALNVPGIASVQVTMKDYVLEPASDDGSGLTRYTVRLSAHVVAKAFGFVVKDINRTETGTLGIDPNTLMVARFELPFLQRLKSEVKAATGTS